MRGAVRVEWGVLVSSYERTFPTVRKLVEDLVTSALSQAVQSGELALPELPAPSVERPRDLEHGDWATSVALKLAKQAHMIHLPAGETYRNEMTITLE